VQVTLVTRDKESALQALTTLQQQHDNLSSQQSHWDELRKASEKIEMLTTLIGQADNEELKELRTQRDRSKVLEGEHAALQKRYKEQESKILNSERAAVTMRQSLAQAQQRSSEWERRAKDYEAQLEITQTQLEQAEQSHIQLDADYSLVKLQLEEQEADDRLAQVKRSLRRHVLSLQN
jgi:chromosome segregation ATPase